MTSNLEHLASLRRHTAQVVSLRPFDTVLKVRLDEIAAAILIETFSCKETAREVNFNARNLKLISFTREGETQYWIKTGELVTPDDAFIPYTFVKYGKSVSPREYNAKRQWERETYRPGTSRNPLDNYQRVLAGPSTPEMERYW